ncbi:hypothetical protein BHE74_00046833 [Ensete ventricosum]|nr:hypothetical protein BHE74_00046833 [Ensete ventricosum]
MSPLRYLPSSSLLLLLLFLFLTSYLDFSALSSSSSAAVAVARPVSDPTIQRRAEPRTDLAAAFARWDEEVGCDRFRDKHRNWTADPSAIQDAEAGDCSARGASHISVLVKGWTWIPDEMDNLYSCRCGMTCLWTKSAALGNKPDAVFFEWKAPPKTVRRDIYT